jgi:HSP20 family protein
MSLLDVWRGGSSLPTRREDSPFFALQREMNRVFDDFFRGSAFPMTMGFGESAWPSVDVRENDEEVVVSAELPGLTEKDFELSLSPDGDAIMLKGEKKQEKEEKRGNVYRTECSYGSFHRSIPLPARVDGDKVRADFKSGLLTVHLPKRPGETRRKRIEVKVA